MAFDDLGKGLAAVCNPMTRDKTTNPGAPMSDIAAELERLAGNEAEAPPKVAEADRPSERWRAQRYLEFTVRERNEAYRNHHATIIAALRAVGEVESVLNSAPRNVHTSDLIDKLRRALAGSATPANQRDANNDR